MTLIATRRFRYQGKRIAAGAPVEMPEKDERAHRLVGLVADAPAGEASPAPPARPPKRRGKTKA